MELQKKAVSQKEKIEKQIIYKNFLEKVLEQSPEVSCIYPYVYVHAYNINSILNAPCAKHILSYILY